MRGASEKKDVRRAVRHGAAVARATTRVSIVASRWCAHRGSESSARVLPLIGWHPMLEVLNMSEFARSAGVAVDPMQEAHRLFHRLWSKAYDAPGYDKREWLRFEELLRQLGLRI